MIHHSLEMAVEEAASSGRALGWLEVIANQNEGRAKKEPKIRKTHGPQCIGLTRRGGKCLLACTLAAHFTVIGPSNCAVGCRYFAGLVRQTPRNVVVNLLFQWYKTVDGRFRQTTLFTVFGPLRHHHYSVLFIDPVALRRRHALVPPPTATICVENSATCTSMRRTFRGTCGSSGPSQEWDSAVV